MMRVAVTAEVAARISMSMSMSTSKMIPLGVFLLEVCCMVQ